MAEYLTSGEITEITRVERRELSRLYCEHIHDHKNDIDCYKDERGRLHFNLQSLLKYLASPEGTKTKRLRDYSAIDARVGKPFYLLTNYGHLLATDDDGNIYNLSTYKRLEPYINTEGYAMLKVLLKNGKYKNTSVHQLVAEATLPNALHKGKVHHINSNKTDNRRVNLLYTWDNEHGKLHQVLNSENRDEYNAMVAKIREDNAQPVYKIPCEYALDDGIHNFFYEVNQKGYDEYQKTGDFPASTIIRQFFEYKEG